MLCGMYVFFVYINISITEDIYHLKSINLRGGRIFKKCFSEFPKDYFLNTDLHYKYFYLRNIELFFFQKYVQGNIPCKNFSEIL